jgi:hypothetical protein
VPVSIVNEGTRESLTVRSDARGFYRAQSLAPGDYRITVAHAGRRFQTGNIRLTAGQTAATDVRLPPGAPPPKQIPESGVVLWSGNLNRGETLEIDGDRASKGQLNGELPGVPVLIDVDARLVGIEEFPGPRNGWKRLVLRSRNRLHAVITIKWRLAR